MELMKHSFERDDDYTGQDTLQRQKEKAPSSGIQQGGRQSLEVHRTIMTIRIGVNALKRTF